MKKNWDDAIGAKNQAQNKVDGVKAPWINDDIDSDGVEGYLNKFIAEKTPEVEGFLEELMRANDEVKAKDKRNDIDGAVDGQVQDAYQNVVEAIIHLPPEVMEAQQAAGRPEAAEPAAQAVQQLRPPRPHW